MKILVIGGGGREHALVWQLANAQSCTELHAAPGNPGMEECAQCHSDIAQTDHKAIIALCKHKTIDLVVVGPEAPLVAGLATGLRAEGFAVFGPDTEAAVLEGSKGFMKDLCRTCNIPTAAYERFTAAQLESARTYVQDSPVPVVIKADGLAAGKGVIIAQTREEALEAVDDMLSGERFGDAGAEIVIEEFMDGEELSFFALSDGKDVIPFASAQDHKRAYDGDEGPNTGGMGAYAPAPMMTPELENKIMETIIRPTIDGMRAKGCPFTGVLYAGLMMCGDVPKLIEYNVRFGDPECQALMMGFRGDLAAVLMACAKGELAVLDPDTYGWADDTTVCVVMAAKGYPGAYLKNTPITNLDGAERAGDIKIFHAGTSRNEDGILASTGGRVLGVTAAGDDIETARKKVYDGIDRIDWPEGFCRRDIGWRAVERLKKAG